MSDTDVAREKLLAAACRYVGGRLGRESSEPGPYDDAQQELDGELLDEAAFIYVDLRKQHDRD